MCAWTRFCCGGHGDAKRALSRFLSARSLRNTERVTSGGRDRLPARLQARSVLLPGALLAVPGSARRLTGMTHRIATAAVPRASV